MRSSGSGPSSEADDPAARARALLLESLDEQQRADFERVRGFWVGGGRCRWWVGLGHAPARLDTSAGVATAYCVSPDVLGGMPREDVALTFKLWLEAAPDAFEAEAVPLGGAVMVPSGDPGHLARAMRALAGSRGPVFRTPRPRVRRRRVPVFVSVPPTPEERARAVLNAREIALGLRVGMLRSMLAGTPGARDARALTTVAEGWRPRRVVSR